MPTKTKRRDMTQAQFEAALKKHGFGPVSHFGYVSLPEPYRHISVSACNGGDTYRGMLAYLMQAWRREESRKA